MKNFRFTLAAATALAMTANAAADDNTTTNLRTGSASFPSVVVTVENSAPSRGAFQTPFWIGLHDGNFDIYDRDRPLGDAGLIDAEAVERLAEDGSTGPISDVFSALQVGSPQATLVARSGPFAPGDVVSRTFNVDPLRDRYLSYASMVIPSNDAFIANGSPIAHELFDTNGNFVGADFAVRGQDVLDAGTEVNDEIAANTAFLNQAGPNIGVPEDGLVILHEGFSVAGALAFPDGVLNTPALGFADFLAPNYRAATFSLRYVDLGSTTRFVAALNTANEVSDFVVAGNGEGRATATSTNADSVNVRIVTRNLSGPITMAHLHLGAAGTNGPVVVNLADGINQGRVNATFDVSAIGAPFADTNNPMLSLLNEIAAGNVYVNIHTEQNPGGEIRGQLQLR